MTRLVPLLLLVSLAFTGRLLAAAGGRPMTVDDLLAVKSVADPQVSPDGSRVVYVVSEVDREAGRSNSSLWIVPVAGGEPKQLTTAKGSNSHPRWSPDGSSIAFVSSRSGSNQVWLLPLDGGEARQLTDLPIDVDGPIWSPTGDHLAVVAHVYPGLSPEDTAKKDKDKGEIKTSAQSYDQLMVRHWMSWNDGKRSHLFVVDAKTGAARDLTPDLPVNVPPAPFGGSADYTFSADGKTLAFTAEPLENRPWSTNSDIWTVPVDGGDLTNLTAENLGADAQPSFGAFGQLAYLSQERAGFEADLWVLKIRFPGDDKTYEVSRGLDRPVLSYVWADRDESIMAVIDEGLGSSIVELYPLRRRQFAAGFTPDRSENRQRLDDRTIRGGSNTSVHSTNRIFSTFGRKDNPFPQTITFLQSDATRPNEVHVANSDGTEVRRLTHHNDDLIADLDLPAAESFTFTGADGDEVQGWLVRPPGLEEGKKVPVLFLIHGGPQGSWHNSWHSRWNLGLFAAPGYAVVAVNPRGSTGFGQQFTDQISTDWSGRVYEDLMKGLDFALETYDFLDADRIAAAGGSYGGYMVNWIAGHSDRFRALISHAGVFDLHSMYFTTEELWFPEWEFGGPPWENPEAYQTHSPSNFVQNFKTPTLVIHGALDFRVPDAQGLGMFTALQRRGVPSRYLFFPDEGHWIAKPANRVTWWNEIHQWLAKYLDDSSS